jgi:hypothetical protein
MFLTASFSQTWKVKYLRTSFVLKTLLHASVWKMCINAAVLKRSRGTCSVNLHLKKSTNIWIMISLSGNNSEILNITIFVWRQNYTNTEFKLLFYKIIELVNMASYILQLMYTLHCFITHKITNILLMGTVIFICTCE